MPIADPIVPGRIDYAADGTPASPLYGDVFHSAAGGPEQARTVFVEGSGLPLRWRGARRFVVLETGFGLGLNFLVTWEAWREDPQRCTTLHFVSIEKHPLAGSDLARALANHPSLAGRADALIHRWPLPLGGAHRIRFDGGAVTLTLFFGDVVDFAPRLEAGFDALYLDGFAPGRNPAMWSPAVLRALGRLAQPGATVATWSVAAGVREALAGAGFVVDKRPGFAGKRERLVGHYAPRWPVGDARRSIRPHGGPRRAMVVGAGLAGCAVAHSLAARGWSVEVVERRQAPAQAASGNPAGVFQPLLSSDDSVGSRLSRAALMLGAPSWRAALGTGAGDLAECGVLRIGRDAAHEERQAETVRRRRLPGEWVRQVSCDEASELAGARVARGGWWFPRGGWLRPAALCAAWLGGSEGAAGAGGDEAVGIVRRFGIDGRRLVRDGELWALRDGAGETVATATVAVLATGGSDVGTLDCGPTPPLRRVRGQLTGIPAGLLAPLRCVVAREGYVTPVIAGFGHVLGATYDFDDDSETPSLAGHAGNLARLLRLLPDARVPAAEAWHGRVAFRSVARDRLPAVGALDRPALLCALGLASRGIAWAALAGEVIASGLDGEPMPVERDLLAAMHPGRLSRS